MLLVQLVMGIVPPAADSLAAIAIRDVHVGGVTGLHLNESSRR